MTVKCLVKIDPWRRKTSNLQEEVFARSKQKKRGPRTKKEANNIDDEMVDTVRLVLFKSVDSRRGCSSTLYQTAIPEKNWKKIKDDHFPHRSEQAVRAQWRRILKANPKLLDNTAGGVTASNMEKDPRVDEAAQDAELLNGTDNTQLQT